MDDSQLTPRLKALRARELARGLDPELLRRFVLYVRRYRYPVSRGKRRRVATVLQQLRCKQVRHCSDGADCKELGCKQLPQLACSLRLTCGWMLEHSFNVCAGKDGCASGCSALTLPVCTSPAVLCVCLEG